MVNACGPYIYFGEPVIEACIKAGAHHLDISGEHIYMETIELKYNQEAMDKNVYIITACGFGSIPADLGTVFVERNFNGVINSIETYLETTSKKTEAKGASFSYGAWESAVTSQTTTSELKRLRSELKKPDFPKFSPKLKGKWPFQKSPENQYCLPFMGCDKYVVTRSQRRLFEAREKRPIQIQTYIAFR